MSDSPQTQGPGLADVPPAADRSRGRGRFPPRPGRPVATRRLGAGRHRTPGEPAWTRGPDEVPGAVRRHARTAAGPRVSFGFNLGKIAGQGEDSDPIVRHGRELGLVAVFDGMGGAGGTVYETPDGPRTGAYLASRLARDVVEHRMVALLDPEWNLDGEAAAQDLQRSVRSALAGAAGGAQGTGERSAVPAAAGAADHDGAGSRCSAASRAATGGPVICCGRATPGCTSSSPAPAPSS